MYEERFQQPEIQQLEAKINTANSTLKKLSAFYQKKTYLAKILEEIAQALPQNLRLSSLSILTFSNKEKQETGFQISLSGLAPTREDLFDLRKNLMGRENFKEVNFPLANWTKAENIDFSVSFKILK